MNIYECLATTLQWSCWGSRPYAGVSTVSQFLWSAIFPIFQTDQNTDYLYDTTFIFDRCHPSWAVEKTDKYSD